MSVSQHKLDAPVDTERRQPPVPTKTGEESIYTDDELGTNNYEESLKSSEEQATQELQEIKQSMEGSDMVKVPSYVREKTIDKRMPHEPVIDKHVVANFKGLLRTFKEKTHEDASDEGYDLDIGEYINMKANGYGDCFIEDKDTNGSINSIKY